MRVAGKLSVSVVGMNQEKIKLTLVISKGEYPIMLLLGRDWLDALHPTWRNEFSKFLGNISKVIL